MTFATLGLIEPLLRALETLGYQTPTPVQAQAIPAVLAGRDLMAAAQTGTGKTAGFALPLLQLLTMEGPKVAANSARALILCPTRELAEQVHASVAEYAQHLPLTTYAVYGGVSINPQMMKLRKGVDILVERLEGQARRIMTIIAMSGGIIFTAILVWIGTDFVWHVRQGGQTSPDLEWPMWIIYLAVPLGSALMCFRVIQALYLYITTGFVAHHDHGAVDGIEDEAQDLAKGGHA